MGLGWICCFVEKSDHIVLAGWIMYWLAGLYRMDRIAGYRWIWIVSAGSAGLDRLDWIGSQWLDEDT